MGVHEFRLLETPFVHRCPTFHERAQSDQVQPIADHSAERVPDASEEELLVQNWRGDYIYGFGVCDGDAVSDVADLDNIFGDGPGDGLRHRYHYDKHGAVLGASEPE